MRSKESRCACCGKSEIEIMADLMAKAMCDDPSVAYDFCCGCKKEIGESARLCPVHRGN